MTRGPATAFLAAAALLFCSVAPHEPRIPGPKVILWAWERSEDLRVIDPDTTGIAYLAATVRLQPDGSFMVRPRLQPLYAPPRAWRTAVVRIETPARHVFPDASLLSETIAKIAANSRVTALQIDYDARASERPFYRSLLRGLRAASPIPFGITALASWCDSDAWFAGDPIAEAIPMFFRMGPNESKDMKVRAAACRASVGLSTDETWPSHLSPGARVYVFSPRAWTKADYDDAICRIGRLR
ncbi:MAG TPA: hypothetical protein VKB79_21520 [Bryobacteraceae bacterium]|nr:hypothetical protein [Bryobacteraceae bacterium]